MRHRWRIDAHQGGPQCPQKDLPLRADIPNACPERHSDAKPGQGQRRSAHKDFGDAIFAAKRSRKERAKRLDWVDAEEGNDGAGDHEGRKDRGQGDTEAA